MRLRGLKFWSKPEIEIATLVEAFAASWIEIIVGKNIIGRKRSKPLRLRGLKSYGYTIEDIWVDVEAFAASWIEISKANEKFKLKLSKPLRLRGLKFPVGVKRY